jgi:hypothetical protein
MSWERIGAASGVAAVAFFVAGFVVFLTQDPTGSPHIPNIEDADRYSAYLQAHEDSIKVETLLNSIGVVLFLWFLGNLWARLRATEGGPARVSAIASAGGIAGAVALLMASVFTASAAVSPSVIEPNELYVLSAMSIGLGGAAFTVFFAAVARVILETGALPRVVGVLAAIAAVTSAIGFVSVFADDGIFNPATGAFGLWVRFGAFGLWLAVASASLVVAVGSKPAPRRSRR